MYVAVHYTGPSPPTYIAPPNHMDIPMRLKRGMDTPLVDISTMQRFLYDYVGFFLYKSNTKYVGSAMFFCNSETAVLSYFLLRCTYVTGWMYCMNWFLFLSRDKMCKWHSHDTVSLYIHMLEWRKSVA